MAKTFRRILFTRRVPLGVGTTESLGHGSSLGWLLNQQSMVTLENRSVVVALMLSFVANHTTSGMILKAHKPCILGQTFYVSPRVTFIPFV